MKRLKIGFMSISKASWLTPKIQKLADAARASLDVLDADVVFHGVTSTEPEAIARAADFVEQGVDVVVLHFVTFPVGAIIPAVAQRLDVPFILVSNPEEPGAGGIWEQNSFCGSNMAAHGMNRLRKKYTFMMTPAEKTGEALREVVAVVQAMRALRALRIGQVGGRVPGFYTSNFDELQLRRDFGVAVEVIDLLEIVDTAKTLTPEEQERGAEVVAKSANAVNAVSDEELTLAAKMYAAFAKTAAKYQLNSLAVRCWPEWSDIFGIAPCAVLGMLTDTGFATSCEGDVNGAVTMKLLASLAGPEALPFFVDLISFDEKDNTGVVWHCGAAASGLCRKFEETQLRKHMRVDGGDKKGLTNDFPLKAGRVTVAKFDLDVDNRPRMLIAPGTALDTEPFLRGNPLRIAFDGKVGNLISTIMERGFEHHYAVVHGNVAAEMLLFCRWMGIEPVMPE